MQKPIKPYALIKLSCFALLLGATAIMPAHAADRISSKASSCVAATCSLPQAKSMAAPATTNMPQHRTQRTAGTNSMSPALALAMAFGLRNVQGPVEHSRQVSVRRDPPLASVKQGFLQAGGGGHKKTSLNAAGVRLALED